MTLSDPQKTPNAFVTGLHTMMLPKFMILCVRSTVIIIVIAVQAATGSRFAFENASLDVLINSSTLRSRARVDVVRLCDIRHTWQMHFATAHALIGQFRWRRQSPRKQHTKHKCQVKSARMVVHRLTAMKGNRREPFLFFFFVLFCSVRTEIDGHVRERPAIAALQVCASGSQQNKHR